MTTYIIKIKKWFFGFKATKIQHKVKNLISYPAHKRFEIKCENCFSHYTLSGFSWFSKNPERTILAFIGKDNEDLKKIKKKLITIAKKYGIQRF